MIISESSGAVHTPPVEERIKRNRQAIAKEIPIQKLLATLDKETLIDLISNLVDSNPHLQTEIDSQLPEPTISSVTLVITELEHKLAELMPTESKTDHRLEDKHYERLKPALTSLVSAVLEYADHFCNRSDEFPGTIFSYLHYCTCVIHRLPDWHSKEHNQLKQDAYETLLSFWKKAIDIAASKLQQGKIYGQQIVTEWAKQLSYHDTETNGLFEKPIQQFADRLGWIIGLDSQHALDRPTHNRTIPTYLPRW
ncbi:Cut8 six-helix bundle-domain-containing protein [Phycomyces nitens]|nr:Cut8 six-helix bundle-domain-containing protein [Phycomyces nitens]